MEVANVVPIVHPWAEDSIVNGENVAEEFGRRWTKNSVVGIRCRWTLERWIVESKRDHLHHDTHLYTANTFNENESEANTIGELTVPFLLLDQDEFTRENVDHREAHENRRQVRSTFVEAHLKGEISHENVSEKVDRLKVKVMIENRDTGTYLNVVKVP